MNFKDEKKILNTLVDYLISVSSIDNKGITFITDEKEERYLSYRELYRRAASILHELNAKGIRKGAELVLQIADNEEYVCLFWACILGGIIAVPVNVGKNDEHRLKLFKVWEKLNSPFLVTDQATIAALAKFGDENGYSEKLARIKPRTVFYEEVCTGTTSGDIIHAQFNDIALIQFSSGSTGDPKGVVLTHDNIITNVLAIINDSRISDNDSSLNWMPLTHDMGLICFHMASLLAAINHYIMPTSLFVRHPTLWMKKMSEFKVTITYSPNFGYKHFLSFFNPETSKDWDLSPIRLIFNGAEPISVKLCDTFLSEMSRFGLKKGAMFPVYGLAEATVGVSLSPPGEGYLSLNLDRRFTSVGQTVKEVNRDETNAISFIDVGYHTANCQVKIYDKANREVSEDVIGFIKIKGRNVTSGYYNNKEATEAAITPDGWLNTGDLGFLHNGRLVITGRAKDIIFVNGQNYYPHDLERTAEEVAGIELGKVAACGIFNEKTQQDEIVIFVLFKGKLPAFTTLARNLKKYLNKQIGLEITAIVPVKKIPKTTSGKFQRYKLGAMYKNGEFQSLLQELHALDQNIEDSDIDSPEDEVETKLVAICQEALNIKNIGVTDNLFECGANSLTIVRVAARLNEEFNVEMGFNDYMEQNTIAKLASFINQHRTSQEYGKSLSKMPALIKQPIQEYYPVSSAQKRTYILQKMDEGGASYNNPYIITIHGKLERNKLEETINKIFARHESFRTSFGFVDGELVQKIAKKVDISINYAQATEEQIDAILDEFIRPFDLSKAPLFRMKLIQVADEKHLFLVDGHHSIGDGTSINIFFKELAAFLNGKDLPELKFQYKDYAIWHNNLLNTPVLKKQEEFWVEKFQGEIPALNLPTDFPRPALQSFEGDHAIFKVDAELTQRLKVLALKANATLFMVLLAAYNILLSKYSDKEDIVVGSPVAGRPVTDLENIFGMFVNTLAIRNHPQGNSSFRLFLEKVRDNTIAALANSDYPFELLIAKINLKREPARHPLFETLFVLQNMDKPTIISGNAIITYVNRSTKTSKFDLLWEAAEEEDGIKFNLEYCTKLFKTETVTRLIEHFKNVLKITMENPEIKLDDIDLLTKAEKQQLLFEFNDTETDYPRNKTIQQLFEEQVAKTPDQTAIVYKDQPLTYGELNQKANGLAKILREKGVQPNTVVGLMLERSPEMVISAIGILKAGSAYLPIDYQYPKERINHMLRNSETRILITQLGYLNEINFNGEIIDIQKSNYECFENPVHVNQASDLVYVIYTSGTTGQPKGATLLHQNLVNLIYFAYQKTKVEFTGNIMQFANMSFDVCYQEIFSTLLCGGKLYIASEEIKKDLKLLFQFLKDNQITVAFFPTAFLKFLMSNDEYLYDIPPSVRHIITAGEQLVITESFREHIRKNNISLHNHYGPSETHVATTFSMTGDNAPLVPPIGQPISNTCVYILDRKLNLQPIGIWGELYIAGDNVGRGYLNNPEPTAEKFVPNPFAPVDASLGTRLQRMYKTGDLARWLPDGKIEFLGRIDHQVKIRGYRIELGEIENQLLKHELIKEAVVIAREDTRPGASQGDKYLCAYLATGNGKLAEVELRKFLRQFLPEYMIPTYFVQLDSLPLNPNGKIDRKALADSGKLAVFCKRTELDRAISLIPTIAPRSETELKLADIWKELLGIGIVGIYDNFFELGGHSLKATVLVSRIHKEFNVELPLRQIFISPTVHEMAELITRTSQSLYTSIEPAIERDYYPVSSAQKRMYVLNQITGEHKTYNVPGAVMIEGALDRNRFETVIHELTRRHESFRTSFEMHEGEPVQRIQKRVDLKINYLNLEDGETVWATGRSPIQDIIREFIRPFDLKIAPLLRIGLITYAGASTKEVRHILVYDMHHIISDGISLGILAQEFIRLYKGEKLPEPRIQYKDFSEWQNRLFQSEAIRKKEEYWLDQFAGEIPVLNLPADFTRPAVRNFEGEIMQFELDKALTQGLNRLALENGATLHIVLLAIFNLLLFKYTGQEDIVVGAPISGRRHVDLERIIGMFVNTLALRNQPEGRKTFQKFLTEVKENALRAYECQDYQFETLVEKLEIRRDLSRNPLFDVMLVLQNMEIEGGGIEGLRFKPYSVETGTAKFDITLGCVESGTGINFKLEYALELFKRETIERLIGHFRKIVETVSCEPEIRLAEIEILSADEKEQLLFKFNNTVAEYSQNKTISDLFEEQAEKSPEKIAVVFQDRSLTYRELNIRVNQLARILREKGVKPDSIVGLVVDRSFEMIIGILGIIKAGGAYLPIDPDYPEDRIRYILEDSRTAILLTQTHLLDKISFSQSEIIDLNDKTLYQKENTNPERINKPQHLVYIIYTSGSTGKPKGVMVEHQSLINVLTTLNKKYPLIESDTFLLKTTYTFDVSATELFSPLLGNGRLAILEKGGEKDTGAIVAAIDKYGVSYINFVPSMFNIFIDTLTEDDIKIVNKLKYIFVAGEAISKELIARFNKIAKNVILENLYGPTESTIYVTNYPLSSFKEDGARVNVPIGNPLPNIKIYILDKYFNLVPRGAVGELYIAGDGLARGYLNNPELTAEKFAPNPFVEVDPSQNSVEVDLSCGTRIYKTGDLARWLPDGNLEFLGRNDHQVKIRGYRIEPGEIEACLLKHPSIKEVVVLARDDANNNKYLCAYFVASEELKATELRGHLLESLPDFMLPSYFICVENIPLTSNGKVDRKTLLDMHGNIAPQEDYKAPTNEIEEQLLKIWIKILGNEKVGITDNFFALGGNSLLLIKVHSLINSQFPEKVKIPDLFAYTTISKLANFIERGEIKKIPPGLLTLPPEYFTNEGAFDEYTPLEFEIDEVLFERIKDFSKTTKIAVDELLLSVYIYLFFEATGMMEITVQNLSGKNRVSPIKVNLSNIKNTLELFRLTHQKYTEQATSFYDIKEADFIRKESDTYSVIPFFGNIDLLDTNFELADIYDIALIFNEKPDILLCSCEYNHQRLKKDKIKDLLIKYVNLIEVMTRNT